MEKFGSGIRDKHPGSATLELKRETKEIPLNLICKEVDDFNNLTISTGFEG
jgi:hypothetical protein